MVLFALGVVAFLALWQLARLVTLPLMVRRVLFCALGTLILAPMIAPVGLAVVYIPNGFVLLTLLKAGTPIPEILGGYVELSRFALPSFGVAATLFALIAWRALKADARSPKHRWVAVALPAILLVGILRVHRVVFPDRSVHGALDNGVVERAYGPVLDDVGGLLRIDDQEDRRAETTRLKAVLDSDPAVLAAELYRSDQSVRGQIFSYRRDQQLYTSETCSNKVEAHRNRLSRCTREYGRYGRLDLLQYRHPYSLGEESWTIAVYFEYDAAIDGLLK
ncbi:MAG: hypothetical protein F4X36_06865 [Gammaproteobacteria bacterium]|nr:hypothetical protein [Gammaproteobacteria bacterium]